jgi:hypothetical protein
MGVDSIIEAVRTIRPKENMRFFSQRAAYNLADS